MWLYLPYVSSIDRHSQTQRRRSGQGPFPEVLPLGLLSIIVTDLVARVHTYLADIGSDKCWPGHPDSGRRYDSARTAE